MEEVEEGCQAEPVHVVDLTQVSYDKVELAALLRQWQVGVPLLVQGGLQAY